LKQKRIKLFKKNGLLVENKGNEEKDSEAGTSLRIGKEIEVKFIRY
jgi:hypothetical protein